MSVQPRPYSADQHPLIASLEGIVGSQNVISDPGAVAVWCQDVFSSVPACLAVIQPGSTSEVAAVAHAASEAGIQIVPRGGGMSYTSGYLPNDPQSIMIELSRMNRITEVNLEDRYITVEAGCNWADVKDALKGTGTRTKYWGPLSGLKSSVGGAMSQNSIFFGAGHYGTAADSAISLEVVLADGRIIRTGTAANSDGVPFFRHYGPDLTGLFTGDTGAFGIKTGVSLALIPDLEAKRYASFAFDEAETHFRAMAEISRQNLAAECFSFNPYLQRQRLFRESLAKDVKALTSVVTGSGSLLKGLAEGAKMVAAGRRFAEEDTFSVHVAIEAEIDALAEWRLERVRAIVAKENGREIENTIPKVIHAMPFSPPNSMIGPNGERWVPVHGIVPHSRAIEVFQSIEALKLAHKEALDRHGIGMGCLSCTIGGQATLIEPTFVWEDELMDMHRLHVEPKILGKAKTFPAAPDARSLVNELRSEIAQIFRKAGGTHFQIAKSYPYKDGVRSENWALLEALKAAVDPKALMNPGSLGLTKKMVRPSVSSNHDAVSVI